MKQSETNKKCGNPRRGNGTILKQENNEKGKLSDELTDFMGLFCRIIHKPIGDINGGK